MDWLAKRLRELRNSPQLFEVIVFDGTYRRYRLSLLRTAKGRVPTLVRIERELIRGDVRNRFSPYEFPVRQWAEFPSDLRDAIRCVSTDLANVN